MGKPGGSSRLILWIALTVVVAVALYLAFSNPKVARAEVVQRLELPATVTHNSAPVANSSQAKQRDRDEDSKKNPRPGRPAPPLQQFSPSQPVAVPLTQPSYAPLVLLPDEPASSRGGWGDLILVAVVGALVIGVAGYRVSRPARKPSA